MSDVFGWPALGQRGKQPAWDPADDDIVLTRVGGCIEVRTRDVHGNDTGSVMLSLHNAWALVGLLSLFAGIPLPAKLRKEIRFGWRPKMEEP